MNVKRNPHARKWHCFSCFHATGNNEYKIMKLKTYVYKLIIMTFK